MADRQPRLQVGRLRSEGRCLSIGPDDLASPEETAFILRGSGVHLDAEAVAEMHRRTEGWPAGVHLATLALHAARGRVDVREVVGSNRLIADYFRDVVLASLSVETVQVPHADGRARPDVRLPLRRRPPGRRARARGSTR